MAKTNKKCYFYNFGENKNFDYICPSVYGARCEFFDKFFSRSSKEELRPDCSECSEEVTSGLVNLVQE